MSAGDLLSEPDQIPASGVAAIDRIRVGIGGWTYVPWRKNFYPDGLVQRRELEYASRHLSSIEINGTYYGSQKPQTYARWASETPEGFLFSVKAPRRIVQSKVLARTGGQVEDFVGGIAALGDRLGPIVWQFEKGTELDRDDFEAFLALLPGRFEHRPLRHVLDVRAPDFVDADYLAMVRKHGHATVFTDSRDHPSFADVTADFVYLRLMRSRPDIANGYNAGELQDWASRARTWAAGGEPDDVPRIDPQAGAPKKPRDVFVYFISAAKERNPAAAMALIEQLRNPA